jgi:predicted ATPase/class 3 adenylate cyclase/Tfp pilus assembly protein PilF
MGENRVLLLTDIVDSTLLNQRLGDMAMAELWAAHDQAARGLLRLHRGLEVGRSDGFLVLFDSVDDAAAFAAAYHHRLAAFTPALQARIGIHAGAVNLRENSAADRAQGATPFEVDGIALPLAARLMAAANGGQTLLSLAAASLLAAPAPQRRSHGHWRFKGVEEPTEVVEVGDEGAAFAPPRDSEKAYRVVEVDGQWRPARELPHHLPAERDAFVGRESALRSVAQAIDGGARLLTLLGMGGIGKTRLALRYARGWLGDFPGGAWFCDLAPARGLDGIYFAVAQGLQVQLGRKEPVVQIADAMAGRGRCLVILDNFEQVSDLAGPTLGAWLDKVPQARFLVTSRELLGLPGETVLDVQPLQRRDAADLFLRRARSAHQEFTPSVADRDAVDQLAVTLDGLPLAIELAAARVRVMPPQVLLQRMHSRFDLLRSRGGRPDRQATLRATLDWSWDLLDASERSVLAQLSVFQGSFGVEAVEAIVQLAQPGPVLDLLEALVAKSLVRLLEGHRFSLLESVREYAAQQLQVGPADDAGALQARHWHHFAGLSEHAAVGNRCADLDNLVAACRSACASNDAASATRCLVNAWAALRFAGPYRAAVDLATPVAQMPDLTAEQAGLVHWVWGNALALLGQADAAREHFRVGLEQTADVTPSEASARLELALSSRLSLEGELVQAQACQERALVQAIELRLDWLQAHALNALGRLMDHQAKVTEARHLYEEALRLSRAIGDRHMEGGLLGNLGGLHYDLGELDLARLHYEQSLAAAEDVGDRRWAGNACSNLGLLLLEQGRPDEARTFLDRAREAARSTGDARLEYIATCNLGMLLTAQGQLVEAKQRLSEAVDAAAHAADRRSEGQFRGYLAVTLARMGSLDEATAMLDIGEQALRSVSDQLSLALLLCDRAEVETLAGRGAMAQQSHCMAQEIADSLECGAESELRRRIRAVSEHMPIND